MFVVIGIGLIIGGFCAMKDDHCGVGLAMIILGGGWMGAIAQVGY